MPNSKTLSQTILAAFCAILCTHLSALGGGGMNIASRIGAWAKSGVVPTSMDYMRGAVYHIDGIDNTDFLSGQSGKYGNINNATNVIWRNIGTDNNLWPFYNIKDSGSGSFGVFAGSWVLNGFCFNGGGYHLIGGVDWSNVTNIYNSRKYTVELTYSDVTTEPNNLYALQIPLAGGGISVYDGRFSYINNLGQAKAKEIFIDASKRVRSCSVVMDGDTLRFYANGALQWEVDDANVNDESTGSRIYYGGRGGMRATLGRIMMYDYPLISSEVAANYAIDNARFNIPG